MPKITSLEPQKNNPKRFNIFLDGTFVFGADEDLVVDRRLIVGKELTTSYVEQLIKDTEVGKLMERMYRLFNIRQRSEKEVRNYFRIKNLEFRIKGKEEVSEPVVELVIKKLKQKRLLDDEGFARSWVEARSKKKSKKAIMFELYQKGVSKEIIEKVLGDELLVNREKDVAKKLLEKKLKIWKNLPALEFKKKAYEHLLRRRFGMDTIKNVVEDLIKK